VAALTNGERLNIMEKMRLFAVLLALVFVFAGCSQVKADKDTDTAIEIATLDNIESGQTLLLPQQVTGTSLEAAEEFFYGEWQIAKEIAFAPASTFSIDDISFLIGKTLIFSKEKATCFGDKIDYIELTAVSPVYSKSVISKEDFEESNRVTFDKLGIKGDSVTQIEVTDVKGNGATIYIKDGDTLILAGGGVYLELCRIKPQSVMKAYKEVLLNNAEFFSTDSQKKVLFYDFLTDRKIYDTDFNAVNFTVLDMDGDNIPEVIIGLTVNDEPQFYEVLHYSNNTVYGYLLTNRVLGDLKNDGTFIFSGGAADTGVGKLKFDSDDFSIDILGYSKSSQGETDLTVSYFIANKTVEKEYFDVFLNKQTEKTSVTWHEFSQSNIETELSEKP